MQTAPRQRLVPCQVVRNFSKLVRLAPSLLKRFSFPTPATLRLGIKRLRRWQFGHVNRKLSGTLFPYVPSLPFVSPCSFQENTSRHHHQGAWPRSCYVNSGPHAWPVSSLKSPSCCDYKWLEEASRKGWLSRQRREAKEEGFETRKKRKGEIWFIGAWSPGWPFWRFKKEEKRE